MYKIYSYPFGNPDDKRLLYAPGNREALVLSPKLTREVSKGGNLSFTMLRDHPEYGNMQKMSTCITVEQDGKETWRGRVLSHEADWYNRRAVYCEGALSYFNDSAITPFNYEGTLKQFLQHLIDAHNQQCGTMRMKQFELGTVTAALGDLVVHYGDMDAYGVGEDYGSTWDIIDKMVLKVYGGYAYCTYNPTTENNVLNYCDQAYEADRLVNQTIEYGVNLLDFTEKTDTNNMFTRVYPTGNKHTVTRTEWVWKFLWWGKKTEVADHEERYSIRNTSSAAIQKYLPSGYSYRLYQEDGDCNWIQNDAAVAKFGVISKVADYDADSADDLFGAAVQDLQKNSLMTTSYTIKAVDLVDAGYDKDRLGFASYAHIISKPHSIDVVMLCTKLVEPLDAPDKKEYTFGMTRQTLTDRQVANLGKTNLLEEQTNTSERYSGNIYDWVKNYKSVNDVAVKKAQDTANSAKTDATNAAKTATNFLSFDRTTGLRVGHESISGKYVNISNDGIVVTDGNSRVNVKSGSISITDGTGSCTIDSGKITFFGIRNLQLLDFKNRSYLSVPSSGYVDFQLPDSAKNCNYVMLLFCSYGDTTSWGWGGWGSAHTTTDRIGSGNVILPTDGSSMSITFPWDTLHRRQVACYKDKIRFWAGYRRIEEYYFNFVSGSPESIYGYMTYGEDNKSFYRSDSYWTEDDDVCVPVQLYGFM